MCGGNVNKNTHPAPVHTSSARGDINSGTHPAPVHISIVLGECKQWCSPAVLVLPFGRCLGSENQLLSVVVIVGGLNPPPHDFFSEQESLHSSISEISLPTTGPCWGWGFLCYCVYISPAFFSWSFYFSLYTEGVHSALSSSSR